MTAAGDLVARYAQGRLTGSDLQREVDAALEAIANDRELLGRLGLTADEVRQSAFMVSEDAAFDPLTITILIAIGAASNLSSDGVKALWKAVRAHVGQKAGEDALGKEDPQRG